MSNKIEGVPEGWELVSIRRAKKGEFSVVGGGELKEWEFDTTGVYPICRKLPEPLKVEAGKYYKQRDGVVVGPLVKMNWGGLWPWTIEGKRRGDQWNDSGKRCLEGYENTDLVEEVPVPIKIEAGKYYRQIDSRVIGPTYPYSHPHADWKWTWADGAGLWNTFGTHNEVPKKNNIEAEVPAPYRPFANAEEFKPFRDKWIKRKPEPDGKQEGAFQATSYNNDGCYVGDDYTLYTDLLTWKFEDGTPCGIKQ